MAKHKEGTLKEGDDQQVISRDFPILLFYKICLQLCTVKLGNKERFNKEQIGLKEPFPVTNLPFTS